MRRYLFAALVLACANRPATANAQVSDIALISRAQRAPARTLDSTLAAIPFKDWVTALRPLPAARIHWEVNDCGEGGDGRKAPTCVEAILDLAPDTAAHASLIVAGLDGTPGEPGVFMLYAMTGKTARSFKTLGEWAEFVRAR